ncbi:MAG: methionyl-tRNA formyltransferase [Bacteroidetes bacterium]|nr:methionyl-tRNA formyltransferase [Bacteroidota bacterium]
MKIVVMGCQQIAIDFIKYLQTLDDVEIPLIITYELPLDKTYGYESVLEESGKLGINVKAPNTITKTLLDEIREIEPDMIFSIYYRKIFPQSLIDIPKNGCVNIHPGKLPDYRGPVPTAWAIRNGESDFGITIHYIDKGIDTGDVLVQQNYSILEDETGFELYTRAMELGGDLLKKNFYAIVNREIDPVKQKGTGSYYGKMGGKYNIDWQLPREDIRNMIRVHAKPYNPAESLLFNRYLLINRASFYDKADFIAQGPGRIVEVKDDEKLVVSCVDGCLLLEDYVIVPELDETEKSVYLKTSNKLDW